MRKRRLVLWIAGLLMAAIAVTLAAAVVLTESALHPLIKRRASDSAALAFSIAQTANVSATNVCIRADDGVVLDAWWFAQPQPNGRAVMVCHGVADSAFGGMGYALLFLRNGYSVLVPDARGHGQSGGFVTYGLLEARDTVRWLDWMKAHGTAKAFGFGESLGGSVLLESLGQCASFRAVVAECPYSSFAAIADERVARHAPAFLAGFLVDQGLLYTRLRYGVNLADARPDLAVEHTKVPILLIHGLADNKTSPVNSERIARENPADIQLWLVPGAKHTGAYATARREFEHHVLGWFAQALQ